MGRVGLPHGGKQLSAFPSDYILQQFGGIDVIRQQAETARVWLAKTVLAQIASGDRSATATLTSSQLAQAQRALQLVELRALDLMAEWRREVRSREGQEFRQYCSFAFDLRRSLPQSADLEATLKSCLLLSCFAVLGDRSADVRRHFVEQPWTIPTGPEGAAGWAHRLFHTTADAFLRVVRKRGWTDLEEVAKAIINL